jgi:hypothetical protein
MDDTKSLLRRADEYHRNKRISLAIQKEWIEVSDSKHNDYLDTNTIAKLNEYAVDTYGVRIGFARDGSFTKFTKIDPVKYLIFALKFL